MYTDDDLHQAEEQILAIVREAKGPSSSTYVLGRVVRHGIPEAAARAAMWFLIDRHLISFDMDWRLSARDTERCTVSNID
ncbi:MAG TPA: hypothetical protein VGR16_15155 [Thermomicrobiales bacterium]|nr:hypothetical protein [Thermomicrobiales bacterium]